MRGAISLLIFASASIAWSCDRSEDAQSLYNHYYQLMIQETGRDALGGRTGAVRKVDAKTASEALSCLQISAEKENCSANYMLGMAYERGGESLNIPVKKDALMASHFKYRAKIFCKH